MDLFFKTLNIDNLQRNNLRLTSFAFFYIRICGRNQSIVKAGQDDQKDTVDQERNSKIFNVGFNDFV